MAYAVYTLIRLVCEGKSEECCEHLLCRENREVKAPLALVGHQDRLAPKICLAFKEK